jgi:hypothetical protein
MEQAEPEVEQVGQVVPPGRVQAVSEATTVVERAGSAAMVVMVLRGLPQGVLQRVLERVVERVVTVAMDPQQVYQERELRGV